MLVAVQIPIIDLRGFTAVAGRLPLPGWPGPEPDREFLRSFGIVRRRPSGGVNGWLGEASICDAMRGLRFAGPLARTFKAGNCEWSLKVLYRRFHADGIATSKLEVGFDIEPISPQNVVPKIIHAIDYILSTKMKGCTGLKVPLAQAGNFLSDAYVAATTLHSLPNEQHKPLVMSGRPCVVIEHSGRPLILPRFSSTLFMPSIETNQAVFWHHKRLGNDIPVWFLRRNRTATVNSTRQLRMYILRLHAEDEAIVRTLRSIRTGVVAPKERSEESDRLQQFLLDAFRHQRTAERKFDDVNLPIYEQAILYRYQAMPGYYDELMRKIEVINPRGSVKAGVEAYIAKSQRSGILVFGDMIMTENKVENSGAIGVVGEANQSTINTTQIASANKFSDEAKALSAFARTLKATARTADEKIDADAIENASKHYSQDDDATALAWLKRTGAWALKVAEETGAKLAAELIIKATTGI